MPAITEQPSKDQQLSEALPHIRVRACAIARQLRIPREDTEDIFHQALLAFLERRDTVLDPEPWILGTVRYSCLMYWRSRRRKLYETMDAHLLATFADSAPSASATLETTEMRRESPDRPRRCWNPCRSLLAARYGNGKTPTQTASAFGYKPSGIHKILQRCCSALALALHTCGLERPTEHPR